MNTFKIYFRLNNYASASVFKMLPDNIRKSEEIFKANMNKIMDDKFKLSLIMKIKSNLRMDIDIK